MIEPEWRNGEPYVPVTPTDVMIEALNEHLGVRLTHHILSDGGQGEVSMVPALFVSRLFSAYRALTLISHVDGYDTARSWFIGMNPELGEQAPADAIRHDLFLDVAMAVRSYLRNG